MEEKKSFGATNILVLVISAILIGMASMMIFVEGVKTVYFCYAICIVGIISGICIIVRYFKTDSYKNVNAYGFSIGTMIVILGICGLIRADEMAKGFLVILGIILLFGGVIVLQHSMDLRRMADPVWVFAFIISAIIMICSITVIIRPLQLQIDYERTAWWLLMISGGLSFIINIYTIIRVFLFKKKEEKSETEKDKKENQDTDSKEPQTSDDTGESKDKIKDAETISDESVNAESPVDEDVSDEEKTTDSEQE